jgi:hypothetical protein
MQQVLAIYHSISSNAAYTSAPQLLCSHCRLIAIMVCLHVSKHKYSCASCWLMSIDYQYDGYKDDGYNVNGSMRKMYHIIQL